MRLYARRSGLSERALALRAYPGSTPNAAVQRVRLLKGLDAARRREPRETTTLGLPGLSPEDEARQLGQALEINSQWLDSAVVWIVIEPSQEGPLLAPAGAGMTWDSQEAAEAAAEVAVAGSAEWRSDGGLFVVPAGLYPAAEVASLTEAEFSEAASHHFRKWRWFNQVGQEGVGLTHHRSDEYWEILLYLEHYLRGEATPVARDEIVYHLGWSITDHLVPLLARLRRDSPRREALGALVARWLDFERDPKVFDEVAGIRRRSRTRAERPPDN